MRKRRRNKANEVIHHDRWLVSYADFVTLLFAFFVVMYALSASNESQYQAVSQSIRTAFLEKKRQVVILEEALKERVDHVSPIELDEEWVADSRQLQQASDQLTQQLNEQVKDNLVAVNKGNSWIELQMNSELLFLSGSADLSANSLPVLKKVAEILKPLPNQIQVEGHTDNLPIGTSKFPSNWELSSARATTVVRELIKNGINPPRLSAIGYSEFHPVADNKIEEGRFKNRRVSLLIISQDYSRDRLHLINANKPAAGGQDRNFSAQAAP
ncbi:flagellar motor protein MotB [Methylomicrobium sp. RS1]|jgi:chemotaxis protein MotB|uniref:flagellar motor protein MotB n=1 Tax=Candidatus Methylomicrobium oryzae TaxID=2802053 RepID=UPI0019216996|nr:flagellar motor protein MotB [Methylomicrobium sp. RS1]MBL1262242.1 flagellar motor protein MotD [Methylomicrobium sp. RS1]